jgi:hypothetical protein
MVNYRKVSLQHTGAALTPQHRAKVGSKKHRHWLYVVAIKLDALCSQRINKGRGVLQVCICSVPHILPAELELIFRRPK